MTLESVERRLIEATLAHTDGDKPRAAAMLGIGLRTLYRRLEAWGL
jgi:DNA-binding NtrC family response regulator